MTTAIRKSRPKAPIALNLNLIREKELLPLLPFGRSKLWELVKAGRFPRGIKLSARVTCWKAGEVQQWVDGLGAQVEA